MKTFKNILSEVAQPKSSEEKAFKDQHNQKVAPHPVAPDSQFSGDIGKPKAARPADQEDDEANYDQAYGDKPDQEPVLRKGRKFSQFRANESKEMATQAALDKATAASKEGKKKVTLAKAPFDIPKEGLEEGPFKGIGKMMMKNKLNRAEKSLAKQKAANNRDIDKFRGKRDAAGEKAYDKADQHGNDILHQRKRAAAALDRLNRSPDKDVKFPFNKRNEEVEEVTEKVSEIAFGKWNEALKGGQKKLDHNKNGKIDGHDFAIMRARKKPNEEVDVIETTSSAMRHMVTQTGPDGKTRTVMKKLRSDRTDDRGQDVIRTNEASMDNMCCKDCGDMFGKPTKGNACKNDCNDPNQSCWVNKESYNEAFQDGKTHKISKVYTNNSETRQSSYPRYGRDGVTNPLYKVHKKGHYPDDGVGKDFKTREDAEKHLNSVNKDIPVVGHWRGDVPPGHNINDYKKNKSEAKINELDKKTLGSYIKKAHSNKETQDNLATHHKDAGVMADKDKDMYKQFDLMHKHKKKSVNRSMGINRAVRKLVGEGFTEMLDEAVKMGNLRLKNGKNVKVSNQDAKLLNSFYKNLNAKNRRDMEKVMMKDEAGFKEIVGFAREAL